VFTGAVSDEALRSLYHAANLFVYPTMGDSLPLVVMEAMACGLPVVSTTVGGLPYLVTPDCGTLVPPGDSAAVAAAVTAMLESPERMRTAGARGRARVATAFRWEHSARRAVAAYDKVLARKASVREAVFAD
jgi:glycosyltransferase involved in cell wall biosynthesis